MQFREKEIKLKDGRTAILRSPNMEDAQALLDYMKITAAETPYLLRTPEECTMTLKAEEAFIAASLMRFLMLNTLIPTRDSLFPVANKPITNPKKRTKNA